MRSGINQKGLSPVIASVLLILMVVALVVIIFSWSRAFITNQTEGSELSVEKLCSAVNFNVMFNSEDNTLEIINKGDINISTFEIKKYLDGDSEIVKIDVSVPAGKSAITIIDLGIISSFDDIEVYPVLKKTADGKSFTCHNDPVSLF